MHTHLRRAHQELMEVRGQLVGVGPWRLNSGSQSWPQASYLPSLRALVYALKH